jgi:hypothetical protein
MQGIAAFDVDVFWAAPKHERRADLLVKFHLVSVSLRWITPTCTTKSKALKKHASCTGSARAE